MAENGWEVVLNCMPDCFGVSYTDIHGVTQTQDPVPLIEEYFLNGTEWAAIKDYGGIPLWCDLQFEATSDVASGNVIPDPVIRAAQVATPGVNVLQSVWESEFGAGIRRMEQEGSYFKGYQWEGGPHQWINMIRAHSSREICQWVWPGLWGSIRVTDNGAWDDNTEQTFSQLDGNVNQYAWEVFWPGDVSNTVAPASYINTHSTHPNMIQSALGGNNASPLGWWATAQDPVGSQYVTTPVQVARLTEAVKRLKYQCGFPFAGISMQQSSYQSTISSPTVQYVDAVVNSLHLDNINITNPTWPLSQSGVTPTYGGASVCTHNTTKPPDTFANTGNEIIMLKSWSGTTSHTITVSGTLPNGLTKTENYTRTLSPNQGTPIGPFPVDQFGSLATITYDTTNLYVSIVGESA